MVGTHEMQIDGHKIVALSLNPETAGIPVILIHGITASVNFWDMEYLKPFCNIGPCYALSLPGHYPAAFPEDFEESAITAQMMADVLTQAIHRLTDHQPVILAGHSTGGFAVLDIAAHHPDIARCVISISGFAQGRWTGLLGFNQWLTRNGLLGRKLVKWGYQINRINKNMQRAAWRIYAATPKNLYESPYFDTVFRNSYPSLKRLDLDAMVQYFSVMPNIDISPLLPRIKAPTLALTGDRDPIVPPAQARLIAQQVPGADLAIIDDAGHMPFFENSEQYYQALDSWLRQNLRN